MIVRKIKSEEIKRANELFAIAFETSIDNTKTAEQVYEEITSAPTSRYDYYWKERWAAFADDNKTMMSYFSVTPYTVNFDGHHCKMTGISGVASLPQYRRTGGIRGCFEAVLPDMYKNGVAFSYLYPFSTAYYRKFGYEMCCERFRYTIRLNAIHPFPTLGKSYLVEPGNLMLDDIKQVYKVWQNKYNMMVVNGDFEYAWIQKSNPAKDQCFSYVYKDTNGVAKGFMTFRKADEVSGRNLACNRFFFTDIEGFQGLMTVVPAIISILPFELPANQVITSFLPEWSVGAGKCEKVFCGMARVVDVIQVLKMAKYRGNGTLIIKVADSFIPQNNHPFLVRFKDDTAVEVSITDTPADISLGISDFSSLIVGICHPDAITYMESVHVNAEMEKISKLFYQKPNMITEYF